MGFWAAVGVMGTAVSGMLYLFKKKRWV